MIQVITRMPAETPEASKSSAGEPAISGASRIGNPAPSNLQQRIDEDAEQDAAAGHRWRRRLMVANIVVWILIILGIRLLFR